MHTPKVHFILFAVLVSLMACSRAFAQEAYGYASIDIDPTTNTGTGYAMTELDYATSAYYNAVVDAHIEDQNGNIIASGRNEAYQTAVVTLGFGDVLQCVTYRIIDYLILDAIIFDDCGNVDLFGFGYLPFDTWWGYGDFYNDKWLCRYERFIEIAELIETVTDCITVHVTCNADSNQIVPSLNSQGSALRQNMEGQFISFAAGMTGRNDANISCWATDDLGQGVPNVLISLSFNTSSTGLDDGGHQNHTGARPRGILRPSSVRTNNVGNAQARFIAPPFSGSVDIDISANGSQVDSERITTLVPGLQQLFGGTNYMLIGSNNNHPSNHWVKPDVVTSIQQIADDYRNQVYPNGFPAGPAAGPGETVNDYYKFHYNDCSLRLGGKFDLNHNWNANGHHDEHRIGINCDVRNFNVPQDTVTVNGQQVLRWDKVNEIFFNRGSTATLREFNPPHWHLRFYRGVQVAAAEDQTPYNGIAAAIPGQIQAEEFDIGNYGSAFFVPPPADPTDEVGTSVGTYDASDGSTALTSVSGQWTAYTVNIGSGDTYTLNARVASPYSGSIFHVEVDGVNKTGPIYIPNTGSWDSYQIVSLNNISLDAGQHIMTVVVESGGGNVDYLTWTVYQSCNPSYWQLEGCWNRGGDWDYDICRCVYY
jgi:Carbohydrate binding module (family 6)